MFSDISHFERTGDYLSILVAAIFVDLFFIVLTFHGYIASAKLKKWYTKYQWSAFIADVLIIFLGIVLTRFFYPLVFSSFVLWKFAGLAVVIQVIHDLLFYGVFSNVPHGYNAMLDFFKEYAREMGIAAIRGDSIMMVLTAVLSSFLVGQGLNTNIILLVVGLYLTPYLLNYQ